jgi:hypothetical protein
VYAFVCGYLDLKRRCGSSREQRVYATMTPQQLVFIRAHTTLHNPRRKEGREIEIEERRREIEIVREIEKERERERKRVNTN